MQMSGAICGKTYRRMRTSMMRRMRSGMTTITITSRLAALRPGAEACSAAAEAAFPEAAAQDVQAAAASVEVDILPVAEDIPVEGAAPVGAAQEEDKYRVISFYGR